MVGKWVAMQRQRMLAKQLHDELASATEAGGDRQTAQRTTAAAPEAAMLEAETVARMDENEWPQQQQDDESGAANATSRSAATAADSDRSGATTGENSGGSNSSSNSSSSDEEATDAQWRRIVGDKRTETTAHELSVHTFLRAMQTQSEEMLDCSYFPHHF